MWKKCEKVNAADCSQVYVKTQKMTDNAKEAIFEKEKINKMIGKRKSQIGRI